MNIQKIYDRFGDRLYHYLAVKLGSRRDAEDVLQEVFFRFVRYSLRFRFVRNPAAFVFRVARNEANRFLQKKIRQEEGCRQAYELKDVIHSVLSGPNLEDTERVAGALARIPEEQREVIVLKFFEELSFKEISFVCGVPLNTAASRYRYGMEKIRSIMEGKEWRSTERTKRS